MEAGIKPTRRRSKRRISARQALEELAADASQTGTVRLAEAKALLKLDQTEATKEPVRPAETKPAAPQDTAPTEEQSHALRILNGRAAQ